MSELPGRPNLDQLRRQARDLLRAAEGGDRKASGRLSAVSDRQTLSAAQLALARAYGFPSWPKLRAEVLRRADAAPTAPTAPAADNPDNANAAVVLDDPEDLVGQQYADRSRLQPVLDAVLALVPGLPGPVTVQPRETLVSLATPRRVFALLKPTTKSRVDLGLRLDSMGEPVSGLLPARNLGTANVRIPLTNADQVNAEVRDWLRNAYEENAAPPAPARRRPPAAPKPALGPMAVVIEGTELPGLSCHPEPDGTVHRAIHVALATSAKAVPEGTPRLIVPGRPGIAASPFPGDAPTARWEVTVTVRGDADEGYDFTGPPVRGGKTDRHLGLIWGDVPGDGTLRLFRGAKLRLVDVPPGVIARALRRGHHLVARVRLTDAKGNPVCARVPATHLTWSAEPDA
jgi:hypothetical protein